MLLKKQNTKVSRNGFIPNNICLCHAFKENAVSDLTAQADSSIDYKLKALFLWKLKQIGAAELSDTQMMTQAMTLIAINEH